MLSIDLELRQHAVAVIRPRPKYTCENSI